MAVSSFLVIFLSVVTSGYARTAASECAIGTKLGFPLKKQPLYIQAGMPATIRIARGIPSIVVEKSKPLTLGCPGTGNEVLGGSQVENVTCVSGTKFLMKGDNVEISEIQCSEVAKSILKDTNRSCGPKGSKIMEAGYQMNRWYKVLEVCHNNRTGVSAYARHTISWMVELGGQDFNERPKFKRGLDHLYKRLDPDELYKKTNQEEVFRTYLGTQEYFDSKKNYLSKGHFAADADFIFSNGQFATYFYVNTAPQWFGLNSGNWLSVERAVRKIANNTATDLDVATGGYEVLELEEKGGKYKEMYLDPELKGIPVPRVFWKAVFAPKLKSGIAFLMGNNPFANEERLCPDICSQNGWKFNNTLQRGMVYCCSFSDLRKHITYLPYPASVTVLQNSKPKKRDNES